MVPACQSFTKDKGTNAVNCVWGVFSTIVTFSAAALYTSIWTGTLVNMWLNGKRDINFQRSLDEFSNITGHSISYHGLWDHAKLGLNYSEVSMENEDPLHVFGLVAPDGSQTHLAYIGNSTGQHKFRLGFGDPSMMPRDSSTSNSKRDPTMNDQVCHAPTFIRTLSYTNVI